MAASNLYHMLNFLPATEAWEMHPALETLAQALVRSGKLRINADHERNYARYGDLTFTARELSEPAFAATTAERIARLVAPAHGEEGRAAIRTHLTTELKKARGIAPEKELRVARVLVQSAHPSVIQLLLRGGTEIFISYSHNVADLMAVHAWAGHGTSSGLQATDADGTAVYVSAGGDPFFEGDHKTYTTDGFPALARMVVIAGQELGHFADLRRSAHGITGRYSTDASHSQLRADPVAAAARLADMARVRALTAAYHTAGLSRLLRAERGVGFYHRRLRYSPPWCFWQLYRLVAWARFIRAGKKQLLPMDFSILPYHRLGEAIHLFLTDMAFNLAPDADAYRHPDPLVEEAIAVIEAVARVPQQVHKWGETAVKAAWPGLYRFYYATILPACERAASKPLPTPILSKYQLLKIHIRRRLRARPGYYP